MAKNTHRHKIYIYIYDIYTLPVLDMICNTIRENKTATSVDVIGKASTAARRQ